MKLLRSYYRLNCFLIILGGVLFSGLLSQSFAQSCHPQGASCPVGKVCAKDQGKELGTCISNINPCGDGYCDYYAKETVQTCPVDCKPKYTCGDGTCETRKGEDSTACPADCSLCDDTKYCSSRDQINASCTQCNGVVDGDGVCSDIELSIGGFIDCKSQSICGNGVVNAPQEECDGNNSQCSAGSFCTSTCTCEPIPDCSAPGSCGSCASYGPQFICGANQNNQCGCVIDPEYGKNTTCSIDFTTCGSGCVVDQEPFDVFLIADESESMREKGKFKTQILNTSIKSIIKSLPAGSRVSLITFADNAKVVQELSDLDKASASAPTSPLSGRTRASTVQSLTAKERILQWEPTRGYQNSLTNYIAAFDALDAQIQKYQSTFQGRNQIIYFFSDGEPTKGGTQLTYTETLTREVKKGGYYENDSSVFGGKKRVQEYTVTETYQSPLSTPQKIACGPEEIMNCHLPETVKRVDTFAKKYPNLKRIAIALDVQQKYRFLLENHVSSPGLFDTISSSLGGLTYGAFYKSTIYSAEVFCQSVINNQPSNPLNKFVKLFCEMSCEEGDCKEYGGVHAAQPADSTVLGCESGAYVDTGDTQSQRQWTCGSQFGNVLCKEDKVIQCSGLELLRSGPSSYLKAKCVGTGSTATFTFTQLSGTIFSGGPTLVMTGTPNTYLYLNLPNSANWKTTCSIDNEPVQEMCQKTYSIQKDCRPQNILSGTVMNTSGTQTTYTVTCDAPVGDEYNANEVRIDCGNGTSGGVFTQGPIGGDAERRVKGECTYTTPGTYTTTCVYSGRVQPWCSAPLTISGSNTPACLTMSPSVPPKNKIPFTGSFVCDTQQLPAGSLGIDCGNGTIVSGSTGSCVYTGYGAYTATCMVDSVKQNTCSLPVKIDHGGGGNDSSICIALTPALNKVNTRKHTANVQCDVDNAGGKTVSIDCGNGTILTGKTEGTCEWTGKGTYTPVCLVNGVKEPKCQTSLTLDGGGSSGGGPNCGDGKVQKGEQCDAGSKNGTATSLCRADCSMKGVNPDPCDDPKTSATEECTPKCAFVDPPSVQMGEYVPFWWDMEDEVDMLKNNEQCDANGVGKLRGDSMECHFTVQAPGNKSFSYRKSCTVSDLKAVGWYEDLQRDLQTKLQPGRGQSIFNSTEWKSAGYGEYAISLDKITYDICTEVKSVQITADKKNGIAENKDKITYEMVSEVYEGRVCQYNFALTTPYMMQKGSALSSLEDDRGVLQEFRLLDGKTILDAAAIENMRFLGGNSKTDSFAQVQKVAYESLKTVINTVEKTHPLATIAQVVKKAPSEEMYLIESDAVISHTLTAGLNRGKATTLIMKGKHTLTINGKLPANLLIIAPEGTVKFVNTDCDSNDVVEGIILASNLITSSTRSALTNTLMNDKQRCSGGQLIVKGLLITNDSDALPGLRSARRSTLQRWFDGSISKQNHIYAGASLRIDANASQWSELPPLAQQTSMVFKLQDKDGSLATPVYLDEKMLPFYLQMMILAGEVSEVN